VPDLKAYLDTQVADHANASRLWCLQAILTPDGLNSLCTYAEELFSPVLDGWVVDEWWDEVNVVMCDFTAGTDLVEAAKVSNARRHDPAQGDLRWFEHANAHGDPPLDGDVIDKGGWLDFKSVHATADGWIYAINQAGNLQRLQDNYWQNRGGPISAWQTLDAGSPTNWLDFRLCFATSVGPDERYIYAVTGDYMSEGTGKLRRWVDAGGDTLIEQPISNDGGWEAYKIAFASDDGWIFAIDSENVMWRWHDGGGEVFGHGTRTSSTWDRWKTAFASSDGVIYATDWDGNMWRWRDPCNGGPLPGGQQLGAGWEDFRMMFATSDGRFYGIR
jgi:hypothetical protein